MAAEHSIGICVDYDGPIYSLAFIRFKLNGDVIVSQFMGDHHRLNNGQKWNPHDTYHGTAGITHVVAYGEHHARRQVQPIGPAFHGREAFIVQGFGRGHAKALGRRCAGFDECLTMKASDIEYRTDTVSDSLGEVTTELPTAQFDVALVEPGRQDLIKAPTFWPTRTIAEKVFTSTFPWCAITVTASGQRLGDVA